MRLLKEGGNVFKNGDGQITTQRINQMDVKPTLEWLEHMVDLDLINNTLGSTGLKPSSGDLDVAVDSSQITPEQLEAELKQWCVSQKLNPRDFVKRTGSGVHFKTPIAGNPNRGYVQTDFMFMKDMDVGKFFLTAAPDSEYKGSDRNVVINSLAKALGYKLSQRQGILARADNTLIARDPDDIAKLLLNPRATKADLYSVETIIKALERDPKRDDKLADARTHFKNLGVPFFENIETPYTEVNFLAKLRDRIVNQGMRPLIESEVQGGRAKGIEHLEDLVFRNGSAGIKRALEIVQHTTADTRGTTTVKWDGKPALVFGRDANGTFILTDVSGFTARGYDGLFASPQQVARHLAQRDAAAEAQGKSANRIETLLPIYQQLWPLLDAAVPRNYRGFFQGDLLYMSTPSLEAGNYVFRPNEIEYKIPAASDIGRRIGASEVGLGMHTKYAEPGAPKEPIGNFKFKTVPGLLLLEPVYAKENVRPETQIVKQLQGLYRSQGAAIDQLFNPADLRALKITDLPKLCIDYINSRVGTNFDQLMDQFATWLYDNTTAPKFKNITEYLQSPRSNIVGMTAAFEAWELLHMIKMDMLGQLDLQHPGQEGWVMATDAGIAKAVNRLAGGFTAANRALNNPDQTA
jgi:hypothetical protein